MEFRQAVFRHEPKRILDKTATRWRSKQKLKNPLCGFVHTDPVNKCTKFQEDLMQTVGGDRIIVPNENLTVA